MELNDHLGVESPLIWLTTDDPARALAILAESCDQRPLFRMHPLFGFCRLVGADWKRVLVEHADGPIGPTSELVEALPVVQAERGTLVLQNAEKLAPALVGLLSVTVEQWRSAVLFDDRNRLPARIICVSHEGDPPPSLVRQAFKVVVPLADAEAVTALLESVAAHLDLVVEDMALATRSAVGMSDAELLAAALASLRETGAIEPEFLGRAKRDAIKAGGLLEVRTPTMDLDSIGGLDRAKSLVAAVAWAWNNPDEAASFQVEPLRRLLMVGVPGTGKSALAEATACSLNLDLAKGGISNVMGSFVGESESNMRRLWSQAKALAPIALWFDEFGRDLSGGGSSNKTDGGTTDRVHGEFLTGLQELPGNIFLLAAANSIAHLPPEMTRADRFDKVMFVGFPTLGEREEIFRIHLGEDNADTRRLAVETRCFTGAEIKTLVREVRFACGAGLRRRASTNDYLAAAPTMKGRVWTRHRGEVVAMYERARGEWEWASSTQEAEAHELLSLAKSSPFTVGASNGH